MSLPIRLVLVDDHAVVRQGIRALLGEETDIEVVAEASSGIEALSLIAEHKPDVVVSDIEMKELDGIELTRKLGDLGSETHVLILSMHDDSHFVRSALEVGARGYVLKETAGKDLARAVRAVACGESYIGTSPNSPSLAKALSNRKETIEGLSGRERDVLKFIALGYTNTEIGKRLSISEKTVGTYRSRLLDKLQLETRSELVQYALIRGIVTPESARREMTRRSESRRNGDKD